MTKKRSLLIAFLFGFLSIQQAKAATIDFSGFNTDMGTVEVGQNGTVTTETSPPLLLVGGILPSFTEITFHYTLTPLGSTIFDSTFDHGANAISTISIGSFNATGSVVDGSGFSGFAGTGDGSLIAAANYIDSTHALLSLINETNGAANFNSYVLSASRFDFGGGFSAYEVTKPYSTPTPTTFPLLGSGLIGLWIIILLRREKIHSKAA